MTNTSHSFFLLKPKLKSHSASLFSASSSITVIFENLKITLDINVMAQAKVNRELASLGADLTCTDVNEGYITCSKSKVNSTIQDAEINNGLPPQGPTNIDKEDAFSSAATTLSLLSPPTDNSNSQNVNQSHMKCYYKHTCCHFLNYFKDPIPDDAVINIGNISFQHNKIEGGLTEFIGNPIGTVFIAVKRDHDFLISQGRNKPNMSSD